MDTVVRINAGALNEAFVEDLKKEFGQAAELEIHVRNAPDSAEILTKNRFWEIIDLLDWSKEGDNDAVTEPVIAALAQMPVACIHQFEDILSEYLWLLDTEKHALASLAGAEAATLSVDYFLYDRCAVVANGRAFFEKVLHNPQEFPHETSFSPLLNIASAAYERKTGSNFIHLPAFNYETYSNEAGWQ
jgi:Protein of unknown function (DUF4240)